MKLLHPSNFYDYQRRAINHQILNPRTMLWLFAGAGKTPVTESTVAHLKNHGAIRGALVLAPLRVCQAVWEREASKWSHTRGLTFSLIHGDGPEERMYALFKKADIYLVNYEGLPWLAVQLMHYFINRGRPMPFDFLVFDEISKMKNSDTNRMAALKPLLEFFPRRTGLTGTPASNGLIDLFGQFYVIDDGARLGQTITDYRSAYFRKSDYGYHPSHLGKTLIHKQIADITLEMAEEDYLQLPDLLVGDGFDRWVDLPSAARERYNQMERSFFTELENGMSVDVENEASKANKLLQMANGFAYTDTETKAWGKLHDAKLEALDELIEEAAGNQILIGYNFRVDAELIQKRFPKIVNLTGMTGNQFNQTLDDFQAGRIQILMGHPASMGHGVDGIQKTCNIMINYGVPWSLEYYQQFVKRVHRNGKSNEPTRLYRILARDTMDEAVIAALETKAQTQDQIRQAVNQYRRKKGWG